MEQNLVNIAVVYGPLGLFALWVFFKAVPMVNEGLAKFLAAIDKMQDKFSTEIEKNREHCDIHNAKMAAMIDKLEKKL